MLGLISPPRNQAKKNISANFVNPSPSLGSGGKLPKAGERAREQDPCDQIRIAFRINVRNLTSSILALPWDATLTMTRSFDGIIKIF
jgi:hypothetical protein